jgi:hypothetical protein
MLKIKREMSERDVELWDSTQGRECEQRESTYFPTLVVNELPVDN